MLKLNKRLRRVRKDVREATKDQQSPWYEMSFSGTFFFYLEPIEQTNEAPLATKPGDVPDEYPGTDSSPNSIRSQPSKSSDLPEDIDLSIPPSASSALPPSVQAERVSFAKGSDRILIANEVTSDPVRQYVLNAREGQITTVRIMDAQEPVSFDVLVPGGEMMADASGIVFWKGYLLVEGDYSINVESDQPAVFTLEMSVSD